MPATDVLLLPGMMCDERLWAPQVDALDLPVFIGDTTRADNFEEMARQVLQDAPPTFAVAGLSMGGILAFEILRQAPERVTHLALIDTTPHPDTPAKRTTRLEQINIAIQGGLRELAVESLKPVYLAECNRDDEELLDVILNMALSLGPDTFEQQSLALKDRPDSMPMLASIDCPAAVICGKEDLLCPVELHELMAREIPNATLTVINDCGHLSTLEQPDAVNRLLHNLFQQQGST